MSCSQLDDPSYKEALGFIASGGVDPPLAYTNNGVTSTLQVGGFTNTVPITTVPTVLYNNPTTLQPNPLPINITLDPPNTSPLNNVTVAQFHWIKQDNFGNQDKYGYIKLGDGYMRVGAEWVGQGPETVIVEGGNIVVNAIGTQNGSAGLELQGGGDGSGVTLPVSSARLWMDTTGQLNAAHLLPLTSTGNQVLFRSTFCEALSTATTAVGAGGQVLLPLNILNASSSQGGVNHFVLSGPTTLQYTGVNTGLFFVTATIALDTTTGGNNSAVAHFKINGSDVPNSASRHTVNQNQESTIVIQAYLTLNQNDTISIALSSADANMSATTYAAVVGPPTIPAEPAVVLVANRIA